VCELSFVSKILAIKMNRKRLVVVLEERIHVYDISNMKILQTIETPLNPTGSMDCQEDYILIFESCFCAFTKP